MDVTKGRQILPADVVPKHYNITLEPNFETFKFKGTVVIDLDVVKETSSISLNTLELDIHNTKILSSGAVVRSVTFPFSSFPWRPCSCRERLWRNMGMSFASIKYQEHCTNAFWPTYTLSKAWSKNVLVPAVRLLEGSQE